MNIIYSYEYTIYDPKSDMKNIEISQETYKRLEQLATGFSDTPDFVISRLLDGLDNKPEKKPELVFFPDDEEKFKHLLIRDKFAEITFYLNDGSRNVQVWNAKKFSESSNLRANLWSGQLRDWKAKGIIKAELSIFPKRQNHEDAGEYAVRRATSSILNIPFSELQDIDFDYEIAESEGQKCLIINFHDTCDMDKLGHIPGFDKASKSVTIGENELNYPLS